MPVDYYTDAIKELTRNADTRFLTRLIIEEHAEKGGKDIEIKATQGQRVALRCCPEHLLVLKLGRDGSFEEVYNGPGEPAWRLVAHKPRPSNGQYQISVAKLKQLMETVPESARIKQEI